MHLFVYLLIFDTVGKLCGGKGSIAFSTACKCHSIWHEAGTQYISVEWMNGFTQSFPRRKEVGTMNILVLPMTLCPHTTQLSGSLEPQMHPLLCLQSSLSTQVQSCDPFWWKSTLQLLHPPTSGRSWDFTVLTPKSRAWDYSSGIPFRSQVLISVHLTATHTPGLGLYFPHTFLVMSAPVQCYSLAWVLSWEFKTLVFITPAQPLLLLHRLSRCSGPLLLCLWLPTF